MRLAIYDLGFDLGLFINLTPWNLKKFFDSSDNLQIDDSTAISLGSSVH